MTFEINEGSNEDLGYEVGFEWASYDLNDTEIYFNQDNQSLGYTMAKTNVVSLRNPANYCNFSEFTISGSGSLKTTL